MEDDDDHFDRRRQKEQQASHSGLGKFSQLYQVKANVD